jgi:hypothetical protein
MRKVLLGVMAALSISGCAKTTPAAPPAPHDGGNFFKYYEYVLTSPHPDDTSCQPKDLHDLLIAPCDGQP